MTKKDYEAFAKVLKARMQYTRTVSYDSAIADIIEDITDIFQSDNPRFDRARFLKACGLDS